MPNVWTAACPLPRTHAKVIRPHRSKDRESVFLPAAGPNNESICPAIADGELLPWNVLLKLI